MDLDPPEDIVMTPEEDLLCAVLRGEPGPWPGETPARLLAASRRHGVLALLYHQLKLTPAWTEWPLEIRQELARTAADQATRDLLRTRELSRVLAALAAAGVEPLLMKGAALAYQLYPSPALRARQDADLLIREAELAATDRALAAGGYRQPGKDKAVSGEPVSAHYQRSYLRRDGYGVIHNLDVHWRISDTPLFTELLSYEELSAGATPIPALGPPARGLGPVHALLLACLHRIHHAHEPDRGGAVPYYGRERLIWLYDIHLLSQTLTAAQWEEFSTLSAEKRLGAVCRDGLKAAREAFGTAFPESALTFLSMPESAGDIPLTWLAGRHGRRLLTDLWHLPDWGQRLAVLKETLFPPAAYLFNQYRTRNRWLLPLLYGHRAVKGVWKYWRR